MINVKKKVLFVAYRMNVGGVEKALLGMLNNISDDEYEVHLALAKKDGGFLSVLPKSVIVHTIESYNSAWKIMEQGALNSMKLFLKNREYNKVPIYLWFYLLCKISKTQIPLYRYLLRHEKPIEEKFDIAISYASPSESLDYYVLNKVNARKKCVWVHYDVSKFYVNKVAINRMYRKYNKIFVVSQTAKEHFDRMFPAFSGKTELFYNIILPQNVLSLSQEAVDMDNTNIKLVTVGRLSKEKGQDIALQALHILKEKKIDVCWYFVGDGILKDECVKLSNEYHLQDSVVFVGTKINPYPYMRGADVYVQPSRHEGYCITLAEARVFAAPIVATNFTGAHEQLSNRRNGIVVNMSADDIAAGIIEALKVGDLSLNEIVPIENTDIEKLLKLIA